MRVAIAKAIRECINITQVIEKKCIINREDEKTNRITCDPFVNIALNTCVVRVRHDIITVTTSVWAKCEDRASDGPARSIKK